MRFMATADTDIGNHRDTNQDSILVRHRGTEDGEVLLCLICDGLGGLSSGELASATIVRAFDVWFERKMRSDTSAFSLQRAARQWVGIIDELNRTILLYGDRNHIHLGSTFSGILFVKDSYLLCHVGDSRIYHIGGHAEQLTEDQTLVASEVKAGRLTRMQAKDDDRKHILMQCVGATASVKPQMVTGKAKQGVYLLCSDGLYHETTEKELKKILRPGVLNDREMMHSGARYLIDLVKTRGETDNISVIIVRARD